MKTQNEKLELSRSPLKLAIGPSIVCCLLLLSAIASPAGTVIKTNNTINLNLATSWVGGQAPGSADMAKWETTVTGANTVSMGADLNWLGVVIANPGGPVTISSGNTLTLGTAGIDMSAATQNFTNSIGLTLLPGAQVWNVQTGRSLVLASNSLGFTRTAGATLSVAGAGTVQTTMKGLTNDPSLPSPGILGPWATIGANSATGYATLSGGRMVAYTNGVSSPFDWPATSLMTNWDVTALSGAISVSHNANTVRYTGAAGSQTNGTSSGDVTLTLNGLMNAATGALTLVKGGTGAGTGLVIGTNRELVLNAATAPIIVNMPVFDNTGGASALTVAGAYGVTLSATGSVSGVTSIVGGSLTLGNPAALQNSTLNYDNLGGTLSFGSLTAATLGGLKGAQSLAATGSVGGLILTINNSASMTYSGVLFGSGGVVKNGTGTWTLGGTNTYTGLTVISNGTLTATGSLASASVLVAGGRLALSGSGSLTCTNLEVASGALFDVSGLSSTFTLGGGQSLVGSGTATGSVATAVGASIYPGKSGLVGTLTCTNALDLSAGGAVYFDLSGVFNSGNDRIVVGQNLSLARTNAIHINALTGGGSLATNGDYVLFAVSGTTTMPSTPLLVWEGTLPANYDHYSLLKSGNNVVLHYNSARVVPTTLEVANLNDTGSGSLRQALQDASDLAGDTIAFDPGVTGKIILTNGELLVARPVNISGPGAELLAISGNNAHRIFHFTNSMAFTNPTMVSISGLTISDGRLVGTNGPVGMNGENVKGAGILNEATLTLTDCVISNNIATGGQGGPTNQFGAGNGGNGFGGGVYSPGLLTMNQCTVVSNAAIGGMGGPSPSSGVGGQGWGGGLYIAGNGSAALTGCTISGNNGTAGSGGGGPGGGVGGGINAENAVTLTNCTIADNIASGSSIDSGGGIAKFGGMTLRSCTIYGNQADFGGGVYGSSPDVGNTIIAGNSASAVGPDCSGTIASSDYNLIQNTNGCSFTGATTHNIIGQNPMLGALQDNGGPTPTMALLAGSPAIDKGNSFGLTTDQRGGVRPFDKSVANASGGDGSDIGAFEVGSYFVLTGLQRAANDVRVSFTTDAGSTYNLQRRDDLVSGSWTNVMTNIPGTGSIITVTNFGVGGLPNGFYRGQSVP